MKISLTGILNAYTWTYIVDDEYGVRDRGASWNSDSPPPTTPGLYLVDYQGRPYIFHLVGYLNGKMLARTLYVKQAKYRNWDI